MKLKNNKGFTGVDVAIALTIILIFVSFIASLFYNLANTSKRINRNSTATDLAIEVIEAMKTTEFANLAAYVANQKEMTSAEINSLTGKSVSIPDGYIIKITIANPNVTETEPDGDAAMGQVIKIITAEVTYMENKEDKTVKIDTLVKNIQ